MNLSQLDQVLRKLSSSEIKYRKGEKNDFWEKIYNDNDHIPCIDFKFTSNNSSSKNYHPSSFSYTINELNISINRNSRFSPVPTHTHDYTEISYMYDGKCTEIIAGEKITFQKGQIIIIDSNSPHSVGVLGENDIMINLLVSRNYLHEHLLKQMSYDSIISNFFVDALRNNTAKNNYLHFHSENNRRVTMFFNELLCECCDPSINSSGIINNLISLIIAELLNVYENDKIREDLASNKASFIPIIHYIEANFKTCTRKNVADIFHIHEKYLTRLIKENTGMTYKQLIQNQKLKYAAKLLKNTDMTITEVINESGYENANFFYKKFREEYSQTPNEYRFKR